MDIRVSFPGGKRADAELGLRIIKTDQSVEHGGDGSAPEPFDLFLASMATCAGVYVLGFCQARGISTDGIELVQHHRFDESNHRLVRIELEIVLPASFPGKYVGAVERAASSCRIKKLLSSPPEVSVGARIAGSAPTARSRAS